MSVCDYNLKFVKYLCILPFCFTFFFSLDYYDSSIFTPCDSVDKDPMNLCKPYNCYIRYDGQRSRWNYTSERCENIPRCMAENENDLMVKSYVFVLV